MGLHLNKDGSATVTWTAEGTEHRIDLPMPTLNQLGEIMDQLDAVWDELDKLTAERDRIRKETIEAANIDEDPEKSGTHDEADLDKLRELRNASRRVEHEGRKVAAKRFIEAIRLLAPGPEAEKFASDPPAWANSINGMNKLINHFNTVPFDGPASEPSAGEAGQNPPQSATKS